jgi:hypothetical protein
MDFVTIGVDECSRLVPKWQWRIVRGYVKTAGLIAESFRLPKRRENCSFHPKAANFLPVEASKIQVEILSGEEEELLGGS